MPISIPASTPESRRRAAAALGRARYSYMNGLGASPQQDAGPSDYEDPVFREVMTAGAEKLPLPEGFTVDDFIFYAANFPYPNRPDSPAGGMQTDVNDIADTHSFIDTNADELIGTGASLGYRYATTNFDQQDDAYIPMPATKDSLIALIKKSNDKKISETGSWRTNFMSSEKGDKGWVWNYLGGHFAAFFVYKDLAKALGRNPTKGEMIRVLSNRPYDINTVSQQIGSILSEIKQNYDKIQEEARRAANAYNEIQRLATTMAENARKASSSAQKAAGYTLAGLGRMRAPRTTDKVRGIGRIASDLNRNFDVNVRINPAAFNKIMNFAKLDRGAMNNILKDALGLDLRDADLSKIPQAELVATASATLAATIADAAAQYGVEIRNRAEKRKNLIGQTADPAQAKSEQALMEADRLLMQKHLGVSTAAKDRAYSEMMRLQKAKTDAETAQAQKTAEEARIAREKAAQERKDFLDSQALKYKQYPEKSLRAEYEKFAANPDADADITKLIVDEGLSRGFDVREKPKTLLYVAGGVAVLGLGFLYMRSRNK